MITEILIFRQNQSWTIQHQSSLKFSDCTNKWFETQFRKLNAIYQFTMQSLTVWTCSTNRFTTKCRKINLKRWIQRFWSCVYKTKSNHYFSKQAYEWSDSVTKMISSLYIFLQISFAMVFGDCMHSSWIRAQFLMFEIVLLSKIRRRIHFHPHKQDSASNGQFLFSTVNNIIRI